MPDAIKVGLFNMATTGDGLGGGEVVSASQGADFGVGFGVGHLQKFAISPVRLRSTIYRKRTNPVGQVRTRWTDIPSQVDQRRGTWFGNRQGILMKLSLVRVPAACLASAMIAVVQRPPHRKIIEL